MTIKKGVAVIGLCGLMITGCAGNMAGEDNGGKAGIYNDNNRQLHTNNHEPDFYNPNTESNETGFGYVRHKRTGVMGANDQTEYTIDREQVANMISRLSTQVPNVDDVSTLVTDEEVLIVYESESDNRSETAEQVKKMAMSIVPGWYHIYVTDNTTLRQNIENFATLNTNSRDIDSLIDGVIRQMRTTPQGQDDNESDNE
jgi:hypothetical protein